MTYVAVIIVAMPNGGYVVKEHDPMNYNTGLLFAGSLGDCIEFARKYLIEKDQQP